MTDEKLGSEKSQVLENETDENEGVERAQDSWNQLTYGKPRKRPGQFTTFGQIRARLASVWYALEYDQIAPDKARAHKDLAVAMMQALDREQEQKRMAELTDKVDKLERQMANVQPQEAAPVPPEQRYSSGWR